MGNLIFLYQESRVNEMESGVASRETMIWNPESGVKRHSTPALSLRRSESYKRSSLDGSSSA